MIKNSVIAGSKNFNWQAIWIDVFNQQTDITSSLVVTERDLDKMVGMLSEVNDLKGRGENRLQIEAIYNSKTSMTDLA
jgi:hypothetical protein